MRMKLAITCILFICLATSAWAGDIVTMPTANQLKQGEVDVAYYYLSLDLPSKAPQYVHYQTVYVGFTDNFELDIHRAAVDNDMTSVVLVGSLKVQAETAKQPDVVVGIRNFTGTRTTNGGPDLESDFIGARARGGGIDSDNASYYVAAAKTFFLRSNQPGPPLVRAHLAWGTADNTLLNETRHQGLFGGLQFLIRPTIGLVAQYDGQDLITGVTFMPKGTNFTIKAGTYGSHQWVGVSWMKKLF